MQKDLEFLLGLRTRNVKIQPKDATTNKVSESPSILRLLSMTSHPVHVDQFAVRVTSAHMPARVRDAPAAARCTVRAYLRCVLSFAINTHGASFALVLFEPIADVYVKCDSIPARRHIQLDGFFLNTSGPPVASSVSVCLSYTYLPPSERK